MTNETPDAGEQITNLRNRLVMLQSDLAVLDERREGLKRDIDAHRNALFGAGLGQQAEIQTAQQQKQADVAPNSND